MLPATELQPRPNVFVVGDAKCGTTSLYRLLQLTDGMGTSRTRKELHFFSAPELADMVSGPGDERILGSIIRDHADYLAEYVHLESEFTHIADVSPSYLQNPASALRIRDFDPEARIVILLREPAAKVFSQYVHLWSEGRETLSFEDAFALSAERRTAGYSTMFDYEAGGYYFEAVKRYLDIFGWQQVFVSIFETLFGPDDTERHRLEAFLGVSFPNGPPPRQNVGGRVRSPLLATLVGNDALRHHMKRFLPLPVRTKLGQFIRDSIGMERPQLDPAMQSMLRRKYAEDVARLEGLIGRETGWPSE